MSGRLPIMAKARGIDPNKNRLYYGDNLEVLRSHIATESVDLVYLDPPFNSNRGYNVIFARHDVLDDAAQIQAFDDTWRWTPTTEQQFTEYVSGTLPNEVANALTAFRTLLGENDAMAYLVNMAPRLVELHRALKQTGSLYLHCDPTMSHYLKVLLDAIFGAENFRNEIIWQRTNSRTVASQWPRVHDVLLVYAGGPKTHFVPLQVPGPESKAPHTLITGPDGLKYQTYELTAPEVRAPTTEAGSSWEGFDPTSMGRHWANAHATLNEWRDAGLIHFPKKGGFPRRRAAEPYVPGARMVPVGDVWTDIDRINQSAKERLGYPTQKPVALLERILLASSREGDVVLDPFCGCGTTIDAAIKLKRRWIGIDVTYIAVDLIEKRLQHTYGESIASSYGVDGIPSDLASAGRLFKKSPFDFERWAVSLINGQPNQRQVGDHGIDGVARFPLGAPGKNGQILISVKGGQTVGPANVRDLLGTVQTQGAEMGVLIMLKSNVTDGELNAAQTAKTYTHPANGQVFPKIQVVTVADLLAGKKPSLPMTLLPYIQATKAQQVEQTATLFD